MVRPGYSIVSVLLGLLGCAGSLILAAPGWAGDQPAQGVKVVLELQGKTVTGKPAVAPADNTFHALYAADKRAPDYVEVKEIGKDIWTCVLKPGNRYVIGWLSDEMFGYQSEPFPAAAGVHVPFAPGLPATFEYDLRHPPKGVEATPMELLLLREDVRNGQRTFLSWIGGGRKLKRPGVLKMEGLAAGTYQISARTSEVTQHHRLHTPMLYENRTIEIKSGVVNRFEPNYPEIDRTVEKGDVTIRGTVYGPDKKPVPGKIIQVLPLAKDGPSRMLYYPAATTDRQGRFEFAGIRPNMSVQVWCQGEDTSALVHPEWVAQDASISVDLFLGLEKLTVQTGKPMPDFAIDWRDGRAGRFSDLAGKIVVIDVWATWCGPCKKAMPALDSLAGELTPRAEVVFVTLSVDYLRPVWEEMVDTSAWKSLRHGWLDRKRNTSYFETPIPYYVIVDKGGIVRAEGYFDVKQELDRVLNVSRP